MAYRDLTCSLLQFEGSQRNWPYEKTRSNHGQMVNPSSGRAWATADLFGRYGLERHAQQERLEQSYIQSPKITWER